VVGHRGGRALGIAVLAVLAVPAAGIAKLPEVGSGPRPGPDALYAAPPVEVPQLENDGPWEARPILVSGASAYRRGEFLYQDFLHDDRGAAGARDESDPFGPSDFTFSPRAGTLTYPLDSVFSNNGADLVELRVKPLRDATALRVTLNSLGAPERTAFTVAIGTSPAARAWPHGAGVSSPAQLFLTVHGASAELRDAATGVVKAPAPIASVDVRRRQFDVRIPHAAWDPGTARVRLSAGVGLWDTGAGRYAAPGPRATATNPGGIAPSGAALFNLAFRFDEPMPDVTQAGGGATIGDAAGGAAVQAAWWRERSQADALAIGDAGRYHADVDFGKLAPRIRNTTVTRRVRSCPRCGPMRVRLALPRRADERVQQATVTWRGRTLATASGDDVAAVTLRRPTSRAFRVAIALRLAVIPPADDSGVPRSGPMDRIFASRHVFGQGVDYRRLCGGLTAAANSAGCDGYFVGQLQTYALYVPRKPPPPRGYGITLLLHSLSANHNQYLDSNNQSQFGERGAGSLVATPAGRGPDGSYRDIAEADAFEVWADVARHYPVDSDWAVVTGYSMGGLGTFRLLARWPDLFARGMSVVGAGSPDTSLPSLRNTPVMSWAAAGDELVNLQRTEATTARLGELGLRFDHWLFAASDHLTLATNDEYGPAAAWLGSHRVDRDPPHVTFVVDPTTDARRANVVADHAFWLSGLRVRDGAARRGTIDVRSEGFGTNDARPTGVRTSAGTLNGGAHGPMPYQRRDQDWGPAPAAARADRLVVRATNVAAAVVDAPRARVSCAPRLDVTSDGPLDLRIACPAPADRTCPATLRIALPRLRGRRIARADVLLGRRALLRARGHDLGSVSLARPSRRAFTLRVVLRAAGTPARTVTLLRRYHAC
jgi:hypothetical protein